jgi:membrane protease YdiL (CAAX protease family)
LRGAADSLNRPQHVYNLAAVVAWGVYIVWRAIRTPGALRAWGFRRDGFRAAMRIGVPASALAAIPLLLFGWRQGRLPLPAGFWLVAALYPLWGIAQQFALQALITRNLRGLVPRTGLRALAAAGIFSASHFPTAWLMALTLIAGAGFALLYERARNLWAVGILHGMLGALAYYCVLGQDPGAELMQLFGC